MPELELRSRLRSRMGREVLIEARAELGDALLDTLIESCDYRAGVFPGRCLIVSVKVGPDCGARLDVAQLQFHGDAGDDGSSGNFLKVVEPAVKQIVSTDIAAQRVNATIMAGGAELAEHDLGDHFRGWFGPAMVFVDAHAFAAGAVNDLVFVVESGGGEAANQERDGNGIGVRCGRVAGNRELVILDGMGGAAAGGEAHRERDDPERLPSRRVRNPAFPAVGQFGSSNHEFAILLVHL